MMKRRTGLVLILVGLVLLGGAAGLYLRNRGLEAAAAAAVDRVTPRIAAAIEESMEAPTPALPQFITGRTPDPNRPMPVINVEGHDYIGCLSIPALDLELPIMSTWNYPKLRIAPCR